MGKQDIGVAYSNIDEGFLQFKYSPSIGAYVRVADGSFRYTEKGWVFDRRGDNVGTFRSVGTFKLSATQTAFSGPGTFTQFDLRGKPILVEPSRPPRRSSLSKSARYSGGFPDLEGLGRELADLFDRATQLRCI